MQSTLQPVDSAFASIRAGVNAAQRPLYRATGGPGYSRSYYEPGVVNDELQVYLLLRNFTVRWRARKKRINDRIQCGGTAPGATTGFDDTHGKNNRSIACGAAFSSWLKTRGGHQ